LRFVEENFKVPVSPTSQYKSDTAASVKTHIQQLWSVLRRNPDKPVEGSSLLPLPYSYIVPGGRFREIYYWDSYFTMLGLQESGEYAIMENMINNFAYMLNKYGHIPNGNRTYYLSRSQPPFFSMMLDLLAETKGNSVYALYQNALLKEHDYYMDKTARTKHVVTMPDGSILNRYWDQGTRPRQESFVQDSTTAIGYKGNRAMLYKNLRTGAESGIDFSSRWFADGEHLSTIQVTNLVAVDLNGLLYHLEQTLAKSYQETGNLLRSNYYNQLAEKRKKAINKYLWSAKDGWYYDYNISAKRRSGEVTILGITPLFFNVAAAEQAGRAATFAKAQLLKSGGFVTTLKNTGEQWDAPNGWAPLQWMAIKGLENYGARELAKDAAARWAQLNIRVFHRTGKIMEKYNVVDTNLEAGGGEYESQDGFGWTNGVLLKLMNVYKIQDR
jgi:alpha,alpha-trehalase